MGRSSYTKHEFFFVRPKHIEQDLLAFPSVFSYLCAFML